MGRRIGDQIYMAMSGLRTTYRFLSEGYLAIVSTRVAFGPFLGQVRDLMRPVSAARYPPGPTTVVASQSPSCGTSSASGRPFVSSDSPLETKERDGKIDVLKKYK
jgi:hypothetical protein